MPAYVQNLQIDDIVGITINSQTNQVSAIEKVFAVNEDGEFATEMLEYGFRDCYEVYTECSVEKDISK